MCDPVLISVARALRVLQAPYVSLLTHERGQQGRRVVLLARRRLKVEVPEGKADAW